MTSSIDIKKFMTVIPELSSEVERCSFLQKGLSDPVRIAVFGKYNHGKSTLLNAVIGKEGVFKASDARETVKNQEFFDKDRNIIWVDTPGLDAD
ncbi:MAG TPA: 50S ribosome-binding GTPase, partial [Agitococcus sp.]|nr:50S ribosome-binding GTPase [Agitococcus sp.]